MLCPWVCTVAKRQRLLPAHYRNAQHIRSIAKSLAPCRLAAQSLYAVTAPYARPRTCVGIRTLCKMIDGQLSVRVLRQKLECNLGLALSYHKVHEDQALVYNCPCRVAQAVCKGAEDLSDASFTGMRRDEDMLDILRFGGCELHGRVSVPIGRCDT
jgi:hypothetical protein